MCRSTDHHYHGDNGGLFYQQRRDNSILKLKSFHLRLSLSSSSYLPESLTLLFPPRISGTPLQVNASKIPPDSPAFLTLHRLFTSSSAPHDAVFASTDPVLAADALRFEVHAGHLRLLKGNLRRERFTCLLDRDSVAGVDLREAEVSVTFAGGEVLTEKVKRRRRRTRCRRDFESCLEEIPEERECDVEDSNNGDASCCCCCDDGRSDGGDEFEVVDRTDVVDVEMAMMEREMEGVRWAVDLGIWVMCLGVGFWVSRASAKRLRLRKFIV